MSLKLQATKACRLTRGYGITFYLLFFSIGLMLSLPNLIAGSVLLSPAYIEKLGREYGPDAKRRLISWQQLITQLQLAPEHTKLEKVNAFFNRVRFIDDSQHWQQADYWATPVEFLISNGGDCEDFSIAKYFTLRELGVPDSKMSIAYVKAVEYNQAHMVLTYYSSPSAMPLVLDNLVGEIKPANQRPDLIHVYSFNGDNLWLSKKGRRAEVVGTSDRLGHWVKLRQRLENKTVNAVE